MSTKCVLMNGVKGERKGTDGIPGQQRGWCSQRIERLVSLCHHTSNPLVMVWINPVCMYVCCILVTVLLRNSKSTQSKCRRTSLDIPVSLTISEMTDPNNSCTTISFVQCLNFIQEFTKSSSTTPDSLGFKLPSSSLTSLLTDGLSGCVEAVE
jgi:hypothetical protein